MSDIENLHERVGSAVERLMSSEQHRQEQNRGLSKILSELETKFDARTNELDHCRERISGLEQSNRALVSLVGELLDVVERTADNIAKDPIYRASGAAGELVEQFISGRPDSDETVVALGGVVKAATAPETETLQTSTGRFEDIEPEYLTAEDLYEKTEGAEAFPKLVYQAITLAGGEAAEIEEPIDIPEPAPASSDASEPEGDLDIKEIMARLEIAAERAQLRADEDSRQDHIEPDVLDRAVGGRT